MSTSWSVFLSVVQIVIGVLLIVYRYPFLRLGRRLLSRWYGPAVAEDVADHSMGPAVVAVGIYFVVTGVVATFDALF